MRLRYPGFCHSCGARLPAGTNAQYDRSTGIITCNGCAEPHGAGVSARREYERRRAKDEQRLRDHWGRLGGLAVALTPERQSTASWQRGAAGEERLGALLDTLIPLGFGVLHDRRIPHTRANIDHIVVSPTGVLVIDAKRYSGRPKLDRRGGLFRPRADYLLVGRRDCTDMLDGMAAQISCVHGLLGDVPIGGSLCFVDSDWPVLQGSFHARGILVTTPRRLMKSLKRASAGDVPVPQLTRAIEAHLPAG